jgi:UDP-glucose:(heptosyl)LPS alpha-1,3-glucosyltransferase
MMQKGPAVHVVAVSDMVKREIEDHYSITPGHLHIVYNGVDCNFFSPQTCEKMRDRSRVRYGIPADTICFLLVSHNLALKGTSELIAALARLTRLTRNILLLVVGSGDPSRYLRLAKRMGCLQHVQFSPSTGNILEAFAAADIYVHPTWYDPCSLATLEAMACGLPVITTRFNGVADLIENDTNGVVIESPADIDTLSRKMIDLLDPRTRNRIGALGRLVAEQYPEERNYRYMLEVFERAHASSLVHQDTSTSLFEEAYWRNQATSE